jgi:hypothetical protein
MGSEPAVVSVMTIRQAMIHGLAKNGGSAICRTSSQNNLGAARGPIRFELIRRCEKWDKHNRSSLELCPTGARGVHRLLLLSSSPTALAFVIT